MKLRYADIKANLANMPPCLAMDDRTHIGGGNGKLTSDFSHSHSGSMEAPDPDNINISQFGNTRPYSYGCVLPWIVGYFIKILLNMVPSVSMNSIVNCCIGNLISFGQLRDMCSPKPKASAVDYFLVRQQRVPIALASRLSSFIHAILHIIFLGSKKQMSGIAAWRIVAFMKHPKAILNGTMCDHPCRSMGKYIHLIHPDYPISTNRRSFNIPIPTCFGTASLNVPPKPLAQAGNLVII